MKEPEQLSIAQLKQMNGQPVRYGRTGEWFIVSLQHPDFGDCIINAGGYYISLAVAAERGVYGYAPAALSKEEWTEEAWEILKTRWEGKAFESEQHRDRREDAPGKR